MKPARIRRNREELQKEAEANFAMSGNEESERSYYVQGYNTNTDKYWIERINLTAVEAGETALELGIRFPADKYTVRLQRKPKLPCHVPNCQSPECDRWHPGDDE